MTAVLFGTRVPVMARPVYSRMILLENGWWNLYRIGHANVHRVFGGFNSKKIEHILRQPDIVRLDNKDGEKKE